MPEEIGEAHGEINAEAVAPQGQDSRPRKCVFSFPHVPRAHVLRSCDLFSQHTLEFDRLSCWPASQLKPFAIW